ncbi:MAG: hypothetical protein P0Y56_02025 [Candidatus Andeanibacterium colombiense]|uniref:Lipoprotein n=1 Tax=Candidatus Andeanibacterium colombiense TaxID=3121345 RepID=A0AAJ5X3H8_9SPHN|nr:MAG: hypothetical protein P0Y56_02025 [Sphingomonadaceae bacterium]
MRRLVLALALFASPALAEHPDLTGFWNLDFGPPAAVSKEMTDALPPNTVVIQDTGVVEFPQNEYGGLKLKPAALAHAQAWKPTDEMTLTRVCAAPSIVYAIQGPFPFEVYQTDGMIVFKYEYFDQTRVIFMDGRGHPPADAPHSKMGHSIGHWEGDELVIDTTHLEPSTITNNGLDHSANIHMIERYRKVGDTLVATEWFEDPEVLDNNGARLIQWKKHPGEYVLPYDCDPSIAEEYRETGGADGE